MRPFFARVPWMDDFYTFSERGHRTRVDHQSDSNENRQNPELKLKCDEFAIVCERLHPSSLVKQLEYRPAAKSCAQSGAHG